MYCSILYTRITDLTNRTNASNRVSVFGVWRRRLVTARGLVASCSTQVCCRGVLGHLHESGDGRLVASLGRRRLKFLLLRKDKGQIEGNVVILFVL